MKDKYGRLYSKKNKAIRELYKLLTDKEVDSINDIPFDVLKTLLYTPYPILVFIPALHKRIKLGWGRSTFQKRYDLTERDARKICDSYK